jgi:hypothetical protein
MKCSECVYYNSMDISSIGMTAQGQCRKSPPIGVLIQKQGMAGPEPAVISFFPEVSADVWCGAFEQKASSVLQS